jgi:hypothetical protein
MVGDSKKVKPSAVGKEISKQALLTREHDVLVGPLAVIEEDSFSSMAPVYVSEKMYFGSDTPYFLEQAGAALTREIEVIRLGVGQHSAP